MNYIKLVTDCEGCVRAGSMSCAFCKRNPQWRDMYLSIVNDNMVIADWHSKEDKDTE